MAFIEINPQYQQFLEAQELVSAERILSLPGVVVGGHASRTVTRVTLSEGEETFRAYLKHEQVTWRTRLSSWWSGWGRSTCSQREMTMLQAARLAGVGCPDWLAAGEDDQGRAFLLVREVSEALDLRVYLRTRMFASARERLRLAHALGEALAHLHDAGFDHPDLYCKHVLIQNGQPSITFLDWQRGKQVSQVGWSRRWQNLAALHASLANDLASPRERLACLRAYLRATIPQHVPRAFESDAIKRILRQARHLLRRRHIRDLRQSAPETIPSELVCLDGESLCVTPDFHASFQQQWPRLLKWVQPPVDLRDGVSRTTVILPGAQQATLVRRRQLWSVARLSNWLLGKLTPSPEFHQIRLLFRLQHYGIGMPRLLAVGQRHFPPWRTDSFLLTDNPQGGAPVTDCLSPAGQAWNAQRKQRRQLLRETATLVRQLHRAACYFTGRNGSSWPPPSTGWQMRARIGEDGTPAVNLASTEGIASLGRPRVSRAASDLAGLWHSLPVRACTRTDRLRFLLAYMGQRRLSGAVRRLAGRVVKAKARLRYPQGMAGDQLAVYRTLTGKALHTFFKPLGSAYQFCRGMIFRSASPRPSAGTPEHNGPHFLAATPPRPARRSP